MKDSDFIIVDSRSISRDTSLYCTSCAGTNNCTRQSCPTNKYYTRCYVKLYSHENFEIKSLANCTVEKSCIREAGCATEKECSDPQNKLCPPLLPHKDIYCKVRSVSYISHSLSQSGHAIYSLSNIGTHRFYSSLNRSAFIATAAELLAYN